MTIDSFEIELERIIGSLRKARRGLIKLPSELEAKERTIRENDDLTTEAKRIAVRKAREEAQATHRRLNANYRKAHKRALELTDRIRQTRTTDPAARERVRALIDQGFAHDKVLERAVELKDDEMIAALRVEAMWHGDPNREPGEAARFADAKETVRACDEALAKVGLGGEKEHNRLILEADELAAPMPEVVEFAGKAATGKVTPSDRLRRGYALSGNREED